MFPPGLAFTQARTLGVFRERNGRSRASVAGRASGQSRVESWADGTRTTGPMSAAKTECERSDDRAVAQPGPSLAREVVFVKYYDKGSTVIGGEQVSRELRRRGFASRVVYAWQLAAVRDAILVFIKTSRLPDLVGARRRGNLLVLDVQDTLCFKRHIKNRRLFHGMIFKNRRQFEDFARGNVQARVIYHQWDRRYRPHRAGEDDLRVAYLGLPRSLTLWGKIPGVCYFEDDWFRRALGFNCHLSLRDGRRELAYKPNSKISTAAACGAVLITTADETALELLGADYPYYTEADPASVQRAIAKARHTLGGREWRTALARLETVRRATSMHRVADAYVSFLARLG